MVRIVSDMVDAYVFRRVNALSQFLLFRRRADIQFGNTWHSVHSKILGHETALQTAERAVRERTGLIPTESYSADYVNTFYDHTTDNLVFAPVFAFAVEPRSRIHLSDEYVDFAWCDREEATARLLWGGQREAIRHIDEIIAQGSEESAFYRISPV